MNSLVRELLKKTLFILITAVGLPSYGMEDKDKERVTTNTNLIPVTENSSSAPSEIIVTKSEINSTPFTGNVPAEALKNERTSTTILISNETSGKTILRNMMLAGEKFTQEQLIIQQEKFENSIKKGAKFFCDIADEKNDTAILAQKTSHEQVMDLLIFLYFLGSRTRTDQTCPAECIINIFEADNKYFLPLYNFLLSYENEYKKQKELSHKNTWIKEPIVQASTPGAHRYNYVISSTQKSRDLAAMRFRNFHVTINSTNNQKSIEIRPEVHGKLTFLGAFKNITNTLEDSNDQCNTKFIPSGIKNIFKTIHQDLSIKPNPKSLDSLSAMNDALNTLSKQETYWDKQSKIKDGIKKFRETIARDNLVHIENRTGKEIILGAEELSTAYFSELNHSENEWKNIAIIFKAFNDLRDAVHTFIKIQLPSLNEEKTVIKAITDFYELICGPNNIREAIGDKFLNDYLLTTAFILESIVLKVHPISHNKKENENLLQNTVLVISTPQQLQELLVKPVFEASYQKSKFSIQQAKDIINHELLQKNIEATMGLYFKTYKEKLDELCPEKVLINSPIKLPGNVEDYKSKSKDFYSHYQKIRINCLRIKSDLKEYLVPKKTKEFISSIVNTTFALYKKNGSVYDESAYNKGCSLFIEMFEKLNETKTSLANNAEKYGFYSPLNSKCESFINTEFEKYKNNGISKKWVSQNLKTRLKFYPNIESMHAAIRKVFENKKETKETIEKLKK